MNRHFRMRCLEKLAQTASVSGSPPDFQIQALFPSMFVAFNQEMVAQINRLSHYLNNVLYYASNGKYNLTQIYNNAASVDITNIPDQDLKKLVMFTKLVIENLFNNKNAFNNPLSVEEINRRLELLDTSQPLNTLSEVNPTGQLGTKTQGNIKTKIKEYLQAIKNSNVPRVAQPAR